jgi:diaminopimelate epimerase
VIPFVKTEALGNDFLLIDTNDAGEDFAALARRICDRRRGVGADGVVFWEVEDAADGSYRVRIFNADGSEAECSGNGLRCLAAYLFEDRGLAGEVRLKTVSGTYALKPSDGRYTADMGIPELAAKAIPIRFPGDPTQVVDVPLEVDGETHRVTCCATGNPHCSLFVTDFDRVDSLGPVIERHSAFPNRTNVEFVRVLSRSEIEVAFWERGAGRTPASGTGSCGAVVASVLNDRTDRKVTVHTENGDLEVEWRADGRLSLVADATLVASGEYRLA